MTRGNRPLTVAIDASWLRDGGIARMAHEIINRAPDHVRVVEIRGGRANAGLLTPVDLAIAARGVDADVIWSPGFMPPMARAPGKRIYITIHDLTHLHSYSAAHRLYFNRIIRPLLANVDRVFTVSEYTRQEILLWATISPDRVIRVHNGVTAMDRLPAHDRATQAPPYVLYVGNRRPYKNIDRMIEAFGRSKFAARGGQLWLTGACDPAIDGLVRQAGVADRVRYLGWLSDDELAATYAESRALIFVSLYEGFGLPVVEAMTAGCPVLTANTTALAEVAGDAALTVNPLSVEEIAEGLDRVALDDVLRARLRSAGLERATQFSWDRCAVRYWQVLTGT
ncbi:glycosyltransferase family 4 protein [Sphingomonas adhaesiva]|uniref:Glycosyltransferase family 1 protein n=1 Tax=Sphingomonas adhaesiva TaxID=28212 RepID=A0A2A4I4C1_9SPHN|nr:glycosyltransferase family 1 protein [Sphingomonas adhaesiva]PCG12958.1 glycosyltransferase family 1 protein [Sphingomonas adhaesiva]